MFHGRPNTNAAERRFDTIEQADAPPLPSRSLGSVVYFARMADGVIKIGHTTNLHHRLHSIRGELLAFRLGDAVDERRVHAQLRAYRAHSREYYRPAPEVMAVVEAAREGLGLAPME